MKMNKILSICMTTALLSSGCSDDLGLQQSDNLVEGQGQTICIAASMSNNKSRLQYDDDDNKSEVKLTWDDTDKLKVINFSSESLLTDFTLTSGAGTSSGVFEATPEDSYTDGNKLYVLYNKGLVQADIDEQTGNVALSLAQQDGTLNDDYQLMFGETTYNEAQGMLGVELKSLITILKVVIPTDKTLTKLTFNNTHNFFTIGTLVLQNSPSDSEWIFQTGDIAYSKTNLGVENNRELSVEGSFVPDDNGNVTIYYYLLRGRGYWGDNNEPDQLSISPNFTVLDSNGIKYSNTSNFGYRVVDEGKMYILQSEIIQEMEKFENEDTANGSAENPYHISTKGQLYTFMLRCYNNESGEYGRYRNLCYKLTNDIELDGSVSWRDFDFNGVFDGDGHTISGNRENTMFGFLLGDAIIRNLKLNVNVTSNESGLTNFGPLARTVDGGQVINCVNMADFSVSNPNAGGLVGAMFSGAKMIGCANTGDILAKSNKIGGLVAELYSGATIECSYSTGKIQFTGDFYIEGDEYHFGGLAGMMNASEPGEWGLATMAGCWTNTTIEAEENKKTDIVFNGSEDFDWFSCFKVESVPSPEDINDMNKSLTNTMYMFGTDGTIVPFVEKEPSITLPEIEVEDF